MSFCYYADEEGYRYLVASDLSWRHTDIPRLYTLRCLVEVVIRGWNRLAKHQGKEGSERGVIPSLLCDHLLLLCQIKSELLQSQTA